MSNLDVMLSTFADFIARERNFDIVDAKLEKHNDHGVESETARIIFNEIAPQGFNQYNLQIRQTPDGHTTQLVDDETRREAQETHPVPSETPVHEGDDAYAERIEKERWPDQRSSDELNEINEGMQESM